MSNVPSDLKYTKSHEWVRVSGDTATVGITDHAQHELTDIVFVELPEIGKQIQKRRSRRRGGIRQDRERHLFTGQRRDSGNQQSRCGQSGPGEHRALRRRLVFQNQIEQSCELNAPAVTGKLPGANRRLTCHRKCERTKAAALCPLEIRIHLCPSVVNFPSENPSLHQIVLPVVPQGDALA